MILGTLLLLLKAHSTTVHSESSFVEYIMNSLIRAVEFILRGVSTGAGFNLCHVYTSPLIVVLVTGHPNTHTYNRGLGKIFNI